MSRTAKSKKTRSSSLRRKKQRSESVLKKELWELCKQIVRLLYQNEDGTWDCYTCDRLIDAPYKAQTGHFIPSSTCGVYLRYDLRNLRIQDYYCNINLGGNGAEFYKRLVADEGQEYVDELFRDKQRSTKADRVFYEDMIDKYTTLLASIREAYNMA